MHPNQCSSNNKNAYRYVFPTLTHGAWYTLSAALTYSAPVQHHMTVTLHQFITVWDENVLLL